MPLKVLMRRTFGHFSPDGQWIVFGAYKERHRPSLFVLRMGSTEPRLLWEGSGFPLWLADPRRIHLWSERGDETAGRFGFVEFDPEAGVATSDFQAIELKPAPGQHMVYNASMTSDGMWLLFGFNEIEADIYVGELR